MDSVPTITTPFDSLKSKGFIPQGRDPYSVMFYWLHGQAMRQGATNGPVLSNGDYYTGEYSHLIPAGTI